MFLCCMSQKMSFEVSRLFTRLWTMQAFKIPDPFTSIRLFERFWTLSTFEMFPRRMSQKMSFEFPDCLKDLEHCKHLKRFLSSMSQEMSFEVS